MVTNSESRGVKDWVMVPPNTESACRITPRGGGDKRIEPRGNGETFTVVV
jgi:hypothetical protein